MDHLKDLARFTVADACDERARLSPDHTALVDDNRSVSWGEVKYLSDNWAMGLFELGLQRGDIAMAQLKNSIELFIMRLACSKAGIRLLCVPHSFGMAEIEPLCRHLAPAAGFIQQTRNADISAMFADIRDKTSYPRVIVEQDGVGSSVTLEDVISMGYRLGPKEARVLERTRFNPLERSFFWCSSGSTGIPKVVEATDFARSLTGLQQAQRWHIYKDDIVGALTMLSTGTSDSLVYHAAPRIAHKIVLTSKRDMNDVITLLYREGVTVATAVPTIITRMLGISSINPEQFGKLRILASHGAIIPTTIAEQSEKQFGVRIMQAYGTTDFGGVAATEWDLSAPYRWTTVGRPLDGNELLIKVDGDDRNSSGKVSRIMVRGPHAVGPYYRNMALTRLHWQDGYFDLKDFGWIDEHGNLCLGGRNDDVIIRGGQNIFPEDIEALLSEWENIVEAAAIGMPDPEMGQRVCLCVVPKRDVVIQPEAVINYLRAKGLTTFKLPERVEVVDQLPLSANELKVNRKKLRIDMARKIGEGQ